MPELQRSTQTTLGVATEKKEKISQILDEYQRICNFFIEWFWERNWTEDHTKSDLLKDVVNLPEDETWLTARLRTVAFPGFSGDACPSTEQRHDLYTCERTCQEF